MINEIFSLTIKHLKFHLQNGLGLSMLNRLFALTYKRIFITENMYIQNISFNQGRWYKAKIIIRICVCWLYLIPKW